MILYYEVLYLSIELVNDSKLANSYGLQLHPGTKTYVINRFCGLASLEPMWRQVRKLADDLLRICSLHPEGVHVIGRYLYVHINCSFHSKCIPKIIQI